METIGILLMCAECKGGVLFSTNPKKKPDHVYLTKFTREMSDMFEGKEGTCARCRKRNVAFMNYHSLPPMLMTKIAGTIAENE